MKANLPKIKRKKSMKKKGLHVSEASFDRLVRLYRQQEEKPRLRIYQLKRKPPTRKKDKMPE